MSRRVLLLTSLLGCATARQESAGDQDADIDAAMQAMPDAAKPPVDAAPTGTCANAFTGVLATYSFMIAGASPCATLRRLAPLAGCLFLRVAIRNGRTNLRILRKYKRNQAAA